MWMAALSPETFELAGTYGFNLLLGSVFGLTPALAVERRRDYFRGLAQAGHSVEDRQIGCLMLVYVADTTEQARREFRDAVEWYFHTVAKYLAVDGDVPVESYEMYNAFRDIAAAVDYETLTDLGYVIAGSPDYVVERLTEAQGVYGMTELLCWTRLGGLDNDKVLRSMELMGEKVFPHLRSLTPPRPEVEPVG
jgi:alkanesulfonate monooxygenase SsuD/methylene tetrahydromethanopterin reductase-like flavin-dependent oxidoreductase (luciferase family)